MVSFIKVALVLVSLQSNENPRAPLTMETVYPFSGIRALLFYINGKKAEAIELTRGPVTSKGAAHAEAW